MGSLRDTDRSRKLPYFQFQRCLQQITTARCGPIAQKKTKIYRKHLHSDRAHSGNVTHSIEERNTTRGSVSPSSQRQHTIFTRSSRVINPNKQTAHDAMKCGSNDFPARRNLGWRPAGKSDRSASDATLARKIGQRCASRRVQTCNNSEKRRKSRTAKSDRVGSQWLKKTGARETKSTTL